MVQYYTVRYHNMNYPDHERKRKKEKKKKNHILSTVVKQTLSDIFLMIVSVPFNFLFGIFLKHDIMLNNSTNIRTYHSLSKFE